MHCCAGTPFMATWHASHWISRNVCAAVNSPGLTCCCQNILSPSTGRAIQKISRLKIAEKQRIQLQWRPTSFMETTAGQKPMRPKCATLQAEKIMWTKQYAYTDSGQIPYARAVQHSMNIQGRKYIPLKPTYPATLSNLLLRREIGWWMNCQAALLVIEIRRAMPPNDCDAPECLRRKTPGNSAPIAH